MIKIFILASYFPYVVIVWIVFISLFTALCSDLDEDSGHGSAGTVSPTASSGVPVRERSGSVGSNSSGWIVLDKTNPDQNSDHTGSKKGNLIAYDPAAIAIVQKQIVLHDSLAFLKCCESECYSLIT